MTWVDVYKSRDWRRLRSYNSIGAEDPELPLWRGSAVDATRLALMSRTEGLKDTMWEGIGGINEMGSTINLM